MTDCVINGCDKKVQAREMCNSHYGRWRRYGDPESGVRVLRPKGLDLEGAFRHFMPGEPPTDGSCWNWSGTRGRDYGQLHYENSTLLAHRVSYTIYTDSLDDDQIIRHTCHNPPCVNPSHLIPGTPADNMQDKVDADRQVRGESHTISKLTESQVQSIREEYVPGKVPLRVFAERYGISIAHVSSIVRRESWKHI